MAGNVQAQELYSISGTTTLAELNTGPYVLPGIAGRKYKIVDFSMLFNGAFTTATAIGFYSANDPAAIGTVLIADATDGALVTPGAAAAVIGADYQTLLDSGEAVVLTRTGSNAAGGTSIDWSLTYTMTQG